MELYNKEDVYDKKISPLVEEIVKICKKHNIPMIASFAYENDDERGIGCCTTLLGFDNRHVNVFEQASKIIRHENSSISISTTHSIEHTDPTEEKK